MAPAKLRGHYKTKSYHNDIELDYNYLINLAENNENLFSQVDVFVSPFDVCIPDEVIKVNYTTNRIGSYSERLNNDREIQVEEIFKLFYDDDENLLPLPERRKNIELKLKKINNGQLTPYYSTIKDTFSFMLKAPI